MPVSSMLLGDMSVCDMKVEPCRSTIALTLIAVGRSSAECEAATESSAIGENAWLWTGVRLVDARLAAMLAEPRRFAGRRVGLVLSGGNIDPRILASIMMRELERESRIVSFRLTIADRPGMLGHIATMLGRLDANILGVEHRRLFLDVPAKGASLDVTVETRDAAHAEEILAALRSEGFAPARINTGDVME